MERLCIWCSEPLVDAVPYIHHIECSCGIRYAEEFAGPFVDDADRSLWESIRRRDPHWKITRDGSTVTVTDSDTAR